MQRDKQIELMRSAEVRTRGYLLGWMKDSAFKQAVRQQNRSDDLKQSAESRYYGADATTGRGAP